MLSICVSSLLLAYRVAAERHVAGERVDAVHREDDDVRPEDHHAHSPLRGLLQVADDGDELHLRAVAVAEHRQRHEDVAREDEGVDVRLHRVPRAALTRADTGAQTRARGLPGVGLDHTGGRLADVVRLLRQVAGVDRQRLAHHHEGQVDDADDGEKGGVAQGSDLLLQGNGEDHAEGHEDEDKLPI